MTHVFKPENMKKLDSDERRKSLPQQNMKILMNLIIYVN